MHALGCLTCEPGPRAASQCRGRLDHARRSDQVLTMMTSARLSRQATWAQQLADRDTHLGADRALTPVTGRDAAERRIFGEQDLRDWTVDCVNGQKRCVLSQAQMICRSRANTTGRSPRNPRLRALHYAWPIGNADFGRSIIGRESMLLGDLRIYSLDELPQPPFPALGFPFPVCRTIFPDRFSRELLGKWLQHSGFLLLISSAWPNNCEIPCKIPC